MIVETNNLRKISTVGKLVDRDPNTITQWKDKEWVDFIVIDGAQFVDITAKKTIESVERAKKGKK